MSEISKPDVRRLIVDADALPEVFVKVADANRMLEDGEASCAAEAARCVGISRSAFYKYRDVIFPYDGDQPGHIITVHAVLRDRPGVLSGVLAAFAGAGANILTVNQNIPAGGKAAVSVSARAGQGLSAGELLDRLGQLDGVVRVGVTSD